MSPFITSLICFFLFFSCSSTTPNGPTIAVMPTPGKPFDVFIAEERICREYAMQTIGGAPKKARLSGAGSAAAGTALGAAAGVLLGGGHQGVATGAGVGLIGGSLVGAQETSSESHDVQWSYDTAYAQCMYSKGNQVPGYQMSIPATPPPPMKSK